MDERMQSAEFAEFLANLMREHGDNTMSLAKKMGISNSMISQLLKGNRQPGLSVFMGLSVAYGIPVGALIGRFSDQSDKEIAREIPLIDSSQLKQWQDLNDIDWPLSHARTGMVGVSDDRLAFWLQLLEGFIQSPSHIRVGDLLLIEPSAQPDNQKFCLVTDRQEWFIAKYAALGKGFVLLPAYPTADAIYVQEDYGQYVVMPISVLCRRSVT